MNTNFHNSGLPLRGYNQPQLNQGEFDIVFWHEIKALLLAMQKNQAATTHEAEILVKLVAEFHQDLQHKPSFIQVLNHANHVQRGDSAWIKCLLFQDDDMYLEVITYFAEYPTPIHDYPDSAIINLPLSGHINIDYYHNGHAALESSYPIAKLRRTETHVYAAYEANMCLPWQKNIQEIRSISERSVVFSIGLVPQQKQENSWYLPISPQNTEAFFAQRLKRNE